MKYRKKPVIIEAVQYDGFNKSEIEKFVGRQLGEYVNDAAWQAGAAAPVRCLFIPTSVGNVEVRHGDYIIKSVIGEFYSCKPDLFERTYEPVTK